MQLSWGPMTVADGVAVVYTVSYSPVVNASGAIDSAATMQKQTTSSTVTLSGLNPTAWYYFRVELVENVAAGGSSSTDSGVGIGGLPYSALHTFMSYLINSYIILSPFQVLQLLWLSSLVWQLAYFYAAASFGQLHLFTVHSWIVYFI